MSVFDLVKEAMALNKEAKLPAAFRGGKLPDVSGFPTWSVSPREHVLRAMQDKHMLGQKSDRSAVEYLRAGHLSGAHEKADLIGHLENIRPNLTGIEGINHDRSTAPGLSGSTGKYLERFNRTSDAGLAAHTLLMARGGGGHLRDTVKKFMEGKAKDPRHTLGRVLPGTSTFSRLP